MDVLTEQTIGTDTAVVCYLRNHDHSHLLKMEDGGYELPWLGQYIPKGHTIYGNLYAMPAATAGLLNDGNVVDLREWLMEETLPSFRDQIEKAGWSNARIGRASILRDPYSAKPFVLFYVNAKAFCGDAPIQPF